MGPGQATSVEKAAGGNRKVCRPRKNSFNFLSYANGRLEKSEENFQGIAVAVSHCGPSDGEFHPFTCDFCAFVPLDSPAAVGRMSSQPAQPAYSGTPCSVTGKQCCLPETPSLLRTKRFAALPSSKFRGPRITECGVCIRGGFVDLLSKYELEILR